MSSSSSASSDSESDEDNGRGQDNHEDSDASSASGSRARSRPRSGSESEDSGSEDQSEGGSKRTRLYRSRSASRSSSRSVSPEQSTRRLFGNSDDEEEENNEEDGRPGKAQVSKSSIVPDDSSDEEAVRQDDEEDRGHRGNDFDMMMMQKKEENRRHRRKKDIEVINDNDDAIAKMIADMRIAAKEDRDLNDHGRPAIKKIGMLRHVLHNLTKVELQLAFIEANLLSVMTDWLAPMPDKSLPHINIRTEFLKLLFQLKVDDPSRLKESGIGKAVMYLYRHPRENKDNKARAGRIIHSWARPIFHKTDNLASMTKEDRRQKDAAVAARHTQMMSAASAAASRKRRLEEAEADAKRPGEAGWVGRARVPQAEVGDYLSRPEWQTQVDISKTRKKEITLLEKHKRKFADRKRNAKSTSLTKISIEGARMELGQY